MTSTAVQWRAKIGTLGESAAGEDRRQGTASENRASIFNSSSSRVISAGPKCYIHGLHPLKINSHKATR